MKLLRFMGSDIHGYLDINIRFNRDLTFVTGINGSGKTSALNAIVALISPDLRMLASLQFREIQLELENNNERIVVSATTIANGVRLSSSATDETFSFNKYVVDPDMPTHRQLDAEVEHYRDLLATNAGHLVLKSIGALPTPMFLGLDRRARFDDDLAKRNRWLPTRAPRTARNVFASSLVGSLLEAEELAATGYRDALIASGKIAEELQQELLLSLLTVETRGQELFESLSVPTVSDIKQLNTLRKDLETLPQILRLPRDEVRARVTPFLDALQGYAENIPRNTKIRELIEQDSSKSPIFAAIISWSANQVHIKRIRVISSIVEKYNARRSELLAPTKKYVELINGFLKDSGKEVRFNDRGYIFVQVEGIDGEKSISFLSSGEAQMFVILTHLSFNPFAQRNVFIIDEPELSLHVQWQEMFVDSVLSANPNIQYVFATHSPSIILDRIKNCVDISGRAQKVPKLRVNQ